MKEKGLIAMLVIAIGVIVMNFGGGIYSAVAGNVRDYIYTFDYCGDGADVATSTRSKGDYTSAYAKNTSTYCAHLISVAGYQEKSAELCEGTRV